jgi:hypothetical protein
MKADRPVENKFNLRNIIDKGEMEDLIVEIVKDEEVNSWFVKVNLLDEVELVIGTNDEIPIELSCRLYRTDEDLDKVRILTGVKDEKEPISEKKAKPSEPEEVPKPKESESKPSEATASQPSESEP